MTRWTVVVLTTLIASTLAGPAAAQWKWRDAAGRTQYSDLPPPPGTAAQNILQRPAAAVRDNAAPTSAPAPAVKASGALLLMPKASEPELDARRKQAAQLAADAKKADDARLAAAKAENCARAKVFMRTIDGGQRIARLNEKGEREILDDATRAAEAKRTREVMASDCL